MRAGVIHLIARTEEEAVLRVNVVRSIPGVVCTCRSVSTLHLTLYFSINTCYHFQEVVIHTVTGHFLAASRTVPRATDTELAVHGVPGGGKQDTEEWVIGIIWSIPSGVLAIFIVLTKPLTFVQGFYTHMDFQSIIIMVPGYPLLVTVGDLTSCRGGEK